MNENDRWSWIVFGLWKCFRNCVFAFHDELKKAKSSSSFWHSPMLAEKKEEKKTVGNNGATTVKDFACFFCPFSIGESQKKVSPNVWRGVKLKRMWGFVCFWKFYLFPPTWEPILEFTTVLCQNKYSHNRLYKSTSLSPMFFMFNLDTQ